MEDSEIQEDHLSRVPEEILLLIFAKLAAETDLKSVCKCSLVSKRFAAAIPRIPTVFLSIPTPDFNSFTTQFNPLDFPQKFLSVIQPQFQISSSDPEIDALDSLTSPVWDAFEFLHKFKEIRSVHLQFRDRGNEDGLISLLKWKSKFGTQLETFLFLYPTSVIKSFVHELGENEEEQECVSGDELKDRIRLAFDFSKKSVLLHHFILWLVVYHGELMRISITDWKNQGRMCAGHEQVENLRKVVNAETIMSVLGSGGIAHSVRFCHVPALRLPLSGCVMMGATLVLMRMAVGENDFNDIDSENGCDNVGGENDGDEYDDIIHWDFEEDEKVFEEAVKCILTEHKEKMRTLF